MKRRYLRSWCEIDGIYKLYKQQDGAYVLERNGAFYGSYESRREAEDDMQLLSRKEKANVRG